MSDGKPIRILAVDLDKASDQLLTQASEEIHQELLTRAAKRNRDIQEALKLLEANGYVCEKVR